MRLAVVTSLVLLAAPAQARAVSPVGDGGAAGVIARYRAAVPGLMAQAHIPGLAVVLVDGDEVLWQEGFGRTGGKGSSPVTVDTLFSVQSISKLFTATAVMQAVQAGLLDLDAPITTYLPDFTVHSAFEPHPERTMTLRMLLGHTAGFTHDAPVGNSYQPAAGDFDAHVRSISDTWLRFPVGTGYAYSNLGIDLAGYILEQVRHDRFAGVLDDSLLAPLGMHDSTFNRARVHETADRAVGHAGQVRPRVDSPMTAAGGLWTTAADLGRFLRFELGNGVVDGRTVLEPALMTEMRTVPEPNAGAPAGYALGVWRTRWAAGHNADLFNHNGGGDGFRAQLWWLPQLQLGVAMLTNSDEQDLQGALTLDLLRDLVTDPTSAYHARMLALPAQADVVEPDDHFGPPADLAQRIGSAGMAATAEQSRRWAGYAGAYRTGEYGAMSPTRPPSRFEVVDGVAYFHAAEDGTPVVHMLTEFEPGLFLAENGETLDLRRSPASWRGVRLNRVTGGPLTAQWVLLGGIALVASWWLLGGLVEVVRRRAAGRSAVGPGDRAAPLHTTGRRVTAAVASVAAAASLAAVAALVVLPGLADVGFLGGTAFAGLPLRVALHLPLAVALLAAALAGLVVTGASRHWWTAGPPLRVSALAVAVPALAAQLALWHLVGWGF